MGDVVYRDEYVKAYKQFESAPSPIMKRTIFSIILIVLALLTFALSIKLILNHRIFDGVCVYISSIAFLFLSADQSTKH